MNTFPCHRTKRSVAASWLGIVAVCLVATGCGDGRPKRVPVSGLVLLDGKPLPNAAVRFYPPEGRSSAGRTDASGRFVLTCYEPDDGALAGKHQVIVAAIEEITGTTIKWHAPKKYSEPQSSGLTAEFDGPIDDLKFELSWGGDRPHLEVDGRRVEIR